MLPRLVSPPQKTPPFLVALMVLSPQRAWLKCALQLPSLCGLFLPFVNAKTTQRPGPPSEPSAAVQGLVWRPCLPQRGDCFLSVFKLICQMRSGGIRGSSRPLGPQFDYSVEKKVGGIPEKAPAKPPFPRSRLPSVAGSCEAAVDSCQVCGLPSPSFPLLF